MEKKYKQSWSVYKKIAEKQQDEKTEKTKNIEKNVVPKPYTFQDDFCLVIDTREQHPLFHPLPKGLLVVRDTLTHGDYSIRGFEDKIAIERKKMSDLMSYIGVERDKTAVKLHAMKDLTFKALVVEEAWDDLFLPKQYSKVPSEVIRQALVSFNVRFGLHIFVHPYRDVCERWILDRLLYAHKQFRKA